MQLVGAGAASGRPNAPTHTRGSVPLAARPLLGRRPTAPSRLDGFRSARQKRHAYFPGSRGDNAPGFSRSAASRSDAILSRAITAATNWRELSALATRFENAVNGAHAAHMITRLEQLLRGQRLSPAESAQVERLALWLARRTSEGSSAASPQSGPAARGSAPARPAPAAQAAAAGALARLGLNAPDALQQLRQAALERQQRHKLGPQALNELLAAAAAAEQGGPQQRELQRLADWARRSGRAGAAPQQRPPLEAAGALRRHDPELAAEVQDRWLRQMLAQGSLPAGISRPALDAFLTRELDRAARRSAEGAPGQLERVLGAYGGLMGLGQLALLAHSLARLAQQGAAGSREEVEALAGRVFGAALQVARGASTADAVSLIAACAELRLYSGQLLQLLLGCCAAGMQQLPPLQLGVLLHSLVDLGVRPSADWLRAFLLAAEPQLPAFGLVDMERVCTALLLLRQPPAATWLAAAEARLVALVAGGDAGGGSDEDATLLATIKALALLGGQQARRWYEELTAADQMRQRQQQQQVVQQQQEEEQKRQQVEEQKRLLRQQQQQQAEQQLRRQQDQQMMLRLQQQQEEERRRAQQAQRQLQQQQQRRQQQVQQQAQQQRQQQVQQQGVQAQVQVQQAGGPETPMLSLDDWMSSALSSVDLEADRPSAPQQQQQPGANSSSSHADGAGRARLPLAEALAEPGVELKEMAQVEEASRAGPMDVEAAAPRPWAEQQKRRWDAQPGGTRWRAQDDALRGAWRGGGADLFEAPAEGGGDAPRGASGGQEGPRAAPGGGGGGGEAAGGMSPQLRALLEDMEAGGELEGAELAGEAAEWEEEDAESDAQAVAELLQASDALARATEQIDRLAVDKAQQQQRQQAQQQAQEEEARAAGAAHEPKARGPGSAAAGEQQQQQVPNAAAGRTTGIGSGASKPGAAAGAAAAKRQRHQVGGAGAPSGPAEAGLLAARRALAAPGPLNRTLLSGCLEAVAMGLQEVRDEVRAAQRAAAVAAVERAARTADEPYTKACRKLADDLARARQRAEEEKRSARQQALADVVTALLPLLDSFDAAQQAQQAAAAKGAGPLTEGEAAIHAAYSALHAQLLQLLSQQGVSLVDAERVEFDPSRHEAVMLSPAPPGVADGSVLRVLRKGYMVGERLVRAALVVVAQE